MSSSQRHILWLVDTVVVYIKCFDKRNQEKRWAPSSQHGPHEVQKFVNMINLVFFRERFDGHYLNIPLCTALHSYDGLISHFLGRLGRHRSLGGVRAFHVGHEQAYFLIGPPPLRVQLTVIPKRHLRSRSDRGVGWERDRSRGWQKKNNINTTDSRIFETEYSWGKAHKLKKKQSFTKQFLVFLCF